MRINRQVGNAILNFVLSKTELSEAYNEYQNILDMEVVKQDITERLEIDTLTENRINQFKTILNSEKALSEIAREYRFGIDVNGWDNKYALIDALINYIDKMEESGNADD